MAAFTPVRVPCPTCGQTVEVTAIEPGPVHALAALHAECLRAALEGGAE